MAGQSAFLLKRLDVLNTENEKLQKEKEELQTELDNERSRSLIDIKTQATVDELQDQLKNIELAKTKAPVGQSVFLLKKLDELNAENEKLQKEKEELQIEIDNERSRSLINIKTQATIDELQDQLKDIELAKTKARIGQSVFLLKKLDELNADNEKLQKGNEDLHTKVQRIEDELRQVKAELTDKKRELDAAKLDVDQKQQYIRSIEVELDILKKQQDSELTQKDHTIESQKAEFERKLAAKDDELSWVNTQLQQLSSELNQRSQRVTEKDKELRDLNAKLNDKDFKINELANQVTQEKSYAQSFYGNQLSQKDRELASLNQNYTQLQQQNNMNDETIRQLNNELQQANQRIRMIEDDEHNEVQRLLSEISNLKSRIKSYENQLLEKDNELQTLIGELEQKSKTITQLQERFRNVVSEKKVKEMELTKELEDSVSALDNPAQQIQQAREETGRLNQVIRQKDEEIQKLMKREESAQNELKVRAEKIKAHEKTVTELEQKSIDNQRQLREYEAKCERLEGEVNRVNAQRSAGNREHTADEVATSVRRGTLDQKYQRPGGDSDPLNCSGGFNPMNQGQAQYKHQQPFQENPNHYNHPPDRRGYGPIPGQPGDPRSPPHNQGPPPGNMRSPLYGTPPGNQGYPPYQPPPYQPPPMNQAGDRHQQPQDQPLRHTGPVQANVSAELNSDPHACPMCQKRFANSGVLAIYIHAATCNYDPEHINYFLS